MRRIALFTALWWVLTDGDPRALGFAIPAVAAALATSFALDPGGGRRIRIRGLLRFIPFFAWQSIRGSVDVALRAIRPATLSPALIDYPFRLHGPARLAFARVVGLVPGTLTADLRSDHIRVHALDGRLPHAAALHELEEHIAALFGEGHPPPASKEEREHE